jgi:hypothetical protein
VKRNTEYNGKDHEQKAEYADADVTRGFAFIAISKDIGQGSHKGDTASNQEPAGIRECGLDYPTKLAVS